MRGGETSFELSGECYEQLPQSNDPLRSDDSGFASRAANDTDGYKGWLALGIEQLGRDVAGGVESDWMVPLLVEQEKTISIVKTSEAI